MAKKVAKPAIKKPKYLTVAELGKACMQANNQEAIVCLSHDDIPYAVFSSDVRDETQEADEDGDVGSLVLHLDSQTDVAKILTGRAESRDDDDDEGDDRTGDNEMGGDNDDTDEV